MQYIARPITTKVPRLILHIHDHNKSFGSRRIGGTDVKKTMDKSSKSAHKSANKRLHEVGLQLLQAGEIIQ